MELVITLARLLTREKIRVMFTLWVLYIIIRNK